MAAQRALTELCQLMAVRNQNAAPFDFDQIQTGHYLHPSADTKTLKTFTQPSGDIKQDIENIVEQLNTLDFETLALNYSRSYLPIKTAKVFVPGLCHIWPQLANERLYALPVKLGWLQQPNTESTINSQGLYI